MKRYSAGALFGGIMGLLAYLFIPIYSDFGPASMLPTGNVVSDSGNYNSYLSNLPFSVFIWITLEVLGVAAGITAQIILTKNSTKGL